VHPRRLSRLAFTTALAALLLGASSVASAQSTGTSPGKSTSQPTSRNPKPGVPKPTVKPPANFTGDPTRKPLGGGDPSVTVLAEEPTIVESVGLSFYSPADATIGFRSFGEESATRITSHDDTWLVDVRTPRTTNESVTAEAAGEAVVGQLLRSVGDKDSPADAVRSLGKVIERNLALIFDPSRPDLISYRAYVSMPQGGSSPDLVRGYTVVKIAPRQFVAFDLTTTQTNFTVARRNYETMVASARFSDMGDIALNRSTAIQAGLKAFERLTREDYEAAIQVRNDRWERLFVPGPTGAASDEREIAYRRIRCRLGTRAELDSAARSPKTPPTPEGYIFQMDARYLDGARTWDSQSVFFLSFERKDEIWTVRNAVRDGTKTATTTETGSRSDRRMTVQTTGTGQPTKTIEPVFETDGYISQIESFLLPQLLIRTTLPTEYGFYSYQSAAGQIKLRRDILEQPADRPGLWKMTSKLSEDAKKSQTSLYNESGELIRTELPDGSIWEPVKMEQLVKLWRDKDLPMK